MELRRIFIRLVAIVSCVAAVAVLLVALPNSPSSSPLGISYAHATDCTDQNTTDDLNGGGKHDCDTTTIGFCEANYGPGWRPNDNATDCVPPPPGGGSGGSGGGTPPDAPLPACPPDYVLVGKKCYTLPYIPLYIGKYLMSTKPVLPTTMPSEELTKTVENDITTWLDSSVVNFSVIPLINTREYYVDADTDPNVTTLDDDSAKVIYTPNTKAKEQREKNRKEFEKNPWSLLWKYSRYLPGFTVNYNAKTGTDSFTVENSSGSILNNTPRGNLYPHIGGGCDQKVGMFCIGPLPFMQYLVIEHIAKSPSSIETLSQNKNTVPKIADIFNKPFHIKENTSLPSNLGVHGIPWADALNLPKCGNVFTMNMHNDCIPADNSNNKLEQPSTSLPLDYPVPENLTPGDSYPSATRIFLLDVPLPDVHAIGDNTDIDTNGIPINVTVTPRPAVLLVGDDRVAIKKEVDKQYAYDNARLTYTITSTIPQKESGTTVKYDSPTYTALDFADSPTGIDQDPTADDPVTRLSRYVVFDQLDPRLQFTGSKSTAQGLSDQGNLPADGELTVTLEHYNEPIKKDTDYTYDWTAGNDRLLHIKPTPKFLAVLAQYRGAKLTVTLKPTVKLGDKKGDYSEIVNTTYLMPPGYGPSLPLDPKECKNGDADYTCYPQPDMSNITTKQLIPSKPVKTPITHVLFKKVDKNNQQKALPGAKFKLYECSDLEKNKANAKPITAYNQHGESVQEWESGEDGQFGIYALRPHPEGTYCLEETQAPSGYKKLDAPYKSFKVTETETETDQSTEPYIIADERENSPTPPPLTNYHGEGNLPMTGSDDLLIYSTIGMLMTICGLILAKKNLNSLY